MVCLARADVPEQIAASAWAASLHSKSMQRVFGALLWGTLFAGSSRARSPNRAPNCKKRAPFQHALATRAGTEALAHAFRFVAEPHQSGTVISVDGVGAYDQIYHSSIFQGLHGCPALVPLIPLVRMFYGGDKTYLFYDDSSQAHLICQAEGGEQGTSMPGLFAIGIHRAIRMAHSNLRPG